MERVVADGRELADGDVVELSATGVAPILRRLAGVDVKARRLELDAALTASEQGALSGAGDASLRRVTTYWTQPHFPTSPLGPATSLTPGMYLVYLDVWQRHRTALEEATLREVALGGPDTGTRTQTVWQVRLSPLEETDAPPTCASIPPWDEIVPQTTGRLSARAHPETASADLCDVPPGAGYRRGENQLYRVEVVEGGPLGTSRFAFSRENGSVVVRWLKSDSGAITVASTGRDAVLGFKPGDWVELTDDTHELRGETGTLAKVTTVADPVLTVAPTPASASTALADFPVNPRVRRWDDPAGARTIETAADNDGYLPLEDGVEIRFEDGLYRTHDHWNVAARVVSGGIEWPVDSAGAALAMPPDGVAHHYCSLALARFDDAWEVVEDCRKLFPPLTEITGAALHEGVHVVELTALGKPLVNDGNITTAQLVEGIEIQCDRKLEPGTLEGKPTCSVTLDLPFPGSKAEKAFWGNQLVGTVPLTLAAAVTVTGESIVWQPSASVAAWLQNQLSAVLQELNVTQVIVHLHIRGNFVYAAGESEVNLDGETFGVLAGARLDAVLPSGDGGRGGDLELWFKLRRPGAPGPGGIVVVAVPAKSKLLKSKAKRAALSKAIGAVLPRDELLAVLPAGFEIDPDAVVDPAQARELVSKQRLSAPGTVPTLILGVEQQLARGAEVVAAALGRNDVPIALEMTVFASEAELVEKLAGGEPPDILLLSQDTFDVVSEEAEGAIAPEGTLAL